MVPPENQGGKEVCCAVLAGCCAGRGCGCLTGTFPWSACSANCKGWKTAGPLGWKGSREQSCSRSFCLWEYERFWLHTRTSVHSQHHFISMAIFSCKILSFTAFIFHVSQSEACFFCCIYYFKILKTFSVNILNSYFPRIFIQQQCFTLPYGNPLHTAVTG